MGSRLRSLGTLLVLGVLLVVAAVWGWSALTEPFPERADPPLCVDHAFDKGDRIARRDVTVSVWNAGTRNGLAGLTMELLVDAGFAEGQEGNAPKRAGVERVEVWTPLPRNHPAVELVASHLGPDPRVVRRDAEAAGVLVVVGDGFEKLSKGKRLVRARSSVEVCGPPVS